MSLLRLILLALGLGLLALIIWAAMTGGQSVFEAVDYLIANPWGIVTLYDLYIGFFFLAVIIWLFERNKLIALLFIAPIPFLGNVWGVIWLIWRLPEMARRFRAA